MTDTENYDVLFERIEGAEWTPGNDKITGPFACATIDATGFNAIEGLKAAIANYLGIPQTPIENPIKAPIKTTLFGTKLMLSFSGAALTKLHEKRVKIQSSPVIEPATLATPVAAA